MIWIVDDLRDGTPVGAVRGSLYLPAGYVKANGATVARADYPRLVALADRFSLWTDDTVANAGLFGRGDGAETFVLPYWTDRMMQFASDGIGATVAAGLPNITGVFEWIKGVEGVSKCAGVFGSQGSATRASSGHGGDVNNVLGFNMDASRSSPIYGASDTVQPPAIKMLPIIRY